MEIRHGELLTIKEQQEVMLDIMKSIHNFCVKHNIRYNMLFGTLLGAVRHKGFIPWDNDIDIGIPRPDYDRLINLLNAGEKIGEHYYHLHYSTDENYFYQITRICDDRTYVEPKYIRKKIKKMGVWVDIFPIDGIPSLTPIGIFRRVRLFINKNLQNADIYAVRGKKGITNKFKLVSVKIFPNAKKRNYLIDKVLRATPFESAKAVGDMEDRHEIIFPQIQDDYNAAILMPFEDAEFYAPKNWEKFLKHVYGDFMQLPPENKRKTHPTGCKWL